MTGRIEQITARLNDRLQPVHLEIEDDSARHAGHAGARSGGGHFNLTIISEAFRGKSPLERHRLVYDALSDYMHRDIHALSIRATTPDESSG